MEIFVYGVLVLFITVHALYELQWILPIPCTVTFHDCQTGKAIDNFG